MISGIFPENSPFGDGNPRCKESAYIRKLLANFGFKCSVIVNNIELCQEHKPLLEIFYHLCRFELLAKLDTR